MAESTVPVSRPVYNPPINYNSDLFGMKPSYNTANNCGDRLNTQYPYTEQDHLALRQLALKNFVRPITVDGRTVQKPIEEKQYSCDCGLNSSPWASMFNCEALKFEVKNGVLKRGCDCLKRNGLQDECPRISHQGRWRYMRDMPEQCPNRPPPRRLPQQNNYIERQERFPYSDLYESHTPQVIPRKDLTSPVTRKSWSYTNYSCSKKPGNTGCKIC